MTALESGAETTPDAPPTTTPEAADSLIAAAGVAAEPILVPLLVDDTDDTPDDDSPRPRDWRRLRPLLWVLAVLGVLALAVALRLWQLDVIPPGLTHDEANHGREAIEILDGVYRYFFPLNYGSEPLYSYTVAGFMALLGKNLMAMRLVNVVFGAAAILMTAVWAARRLDRPTALLGAALMAVSFWPIASSREALRAGMLPFFMALAVWFFWRILDAAPERGTVAPRRLGWFVLGFAATVVATLHIYLAARVAWLVFPVFLVYLALFHRALARRATGPALLGLAAAAIAMIPMAVYLRAHPEMQTRLSMFGAGGSGADQLMPLLTNVRDGLLAFVWPGYGDQFLAYNIPGRPVFDVVSAVFFLLGLLVCLRRLRQPVFAFLLIWFAVGIAPSLITGPTANTTRNLAALPAVYLIPAVGFVAAASWFLRWRAGQPRRAVAFATLLAAAWLGWAGWVSATDYFERWGESAEVRGAYQQTMVSMLDYLKRQRTADAPLLISSVYPGPAHDPSIALVRANDYPAIGREARWSDARAALVVPGYDRTGGAQAQAAVPLSTHPHPAFDPALELIDSIRLQPNDLDPGFNIFAFDGVGLAGLLGDLQPPTADDTLGGALQLVGSRWLDGAARPGDAAELLTVWRVLDPTRAGPIVPPSYTTDAVLFSHVLDAAGSLITQRDALDAPSWAWQAGDLVLQVHGMTIPAETPPGSYRVVGGLYDRASGTRLATAAGATTVELARLELAE